jgi:hypothetical protein
LRDVEVISDKLSALECAGSSNNTVAALNPGTLLCTGNYTVTQENLEAGQLTFTAQATSSSLNTPATPLAALVPVVLVMAAQPQLVLDVVASSCVVLNETGTKCRLFVIGAASQGSHICTTAWSCYLGYRQSRVRRLHLQRPWSGQLSNCTNSCKKYDCVAGAGGQDAARCVVQISNTGNVRLTSLNIQGVDTGCLSPGSTLAVGAHFNCTATR